MLGGAIGPRFAVNHSDRLSRHIPPDDLAPIAVPTTLMWGRHDRANRLRIAQDAGVRDGWLLQVIADCADDPPRDQPLVFLEALRMALGT